MNSQWQLARTPQAGWPVADDFRWHETPLPSPGPGQMLTETLYLSMDPYQWGRRRSGVELPGEVCHGRTVARVLASQIPAYQPGDYVFNTNGWQSHGLTGAAITEFGYMRPRKLDPQQAPISTAIGIMGMLGLTAYAGLMVQCQPRAGETVVVSAASGGVGQVVAQLARLAGCRVVGIAGAASKVQFCLDELGLDACVSHLDEDLAGSLRAACPDGCDVYFESVGGRVYEAVLPLLNKQARITICGMISQYGNTDGRNTQDTWRDMGQVTFERQQVIVHPLFVGNFVDSHQQPFLALMGDHVRAGRVFYKEDRWQGLEQAPAAFSAMLDGRNFGKTIVVVKEESLKKSR